MTEIGTQAHLRYTNLFGSPLRKYTPPIILKPSQTITTIRNRVLHSRISAVAPKRENDAKKRVVITGMGVVSVFGNDVDTFYQRLLAGESGVGPIDRFDVSEFPTRFAAEIRNFDSSGYVLHKHEPRMDDCQRYYVVAGKKALEDASLVGKELSKIDKERAGVLSGSGIGGTSVLYQGIMTNRERGYKKVSPFVSQYIQTCTGPAFLAMDLGFMGPAYSISTVCASSNYCFYAAANHIREGVIDLMIVGGAEACLNPVTFAGFVACKALSQRNNDPQTASRPSDQERDGFVMGEGAGVLSLEHAMKRDAPIHAEYLGGAIHSDAYHITDPRPDVFGIASCLRSSLLNAGVSVEEVNYINAHATSTPDGDIAEIKVLKNVFKNRSRIKMNATKSMIGHSLGASGGMKAIATVKAIQTGWLHPTINQLNLDAEVAFNTIANHKQQHEVNDAISNAFGFGGHNSVVVFSAFKP